VTELTDYQRLVEKPHLARLHAQLAECHAALAQLQAERDEAREALRPFANLGAALPEHYSHDSRFHGPGHPRFWYEIDPKNIWKARSVIDRAASRALGGGE